jgi:hypothetical protein
MGVGMTQEIKKEPTAKDIHQLQYDARLAHRSYDAETRRIYEPKPIILNNQERRSAVHALTTIQQQASILNSLGIDVTTVFAEMRRVEKVIACSD